MNPAYERRNDRAQALGYRNYYDQRTSEARSRGESLSTARGHARDDFAAHIATGKAAAVTFTGTRDAEGRYVRGTFVVVDVDGTQRTYTFKGASLTDAKLRQTAKDLDRAGVPVLPGYDVATKRKGPFGHVGRR